MMIALRTKKHQRVAVEVHNGEIAICRHCEIPWSKCIAPHRWTQIDSLPTLDNCGRRPVGSNQAQYLVRVGRERNLESDSTQQDGG